MTDVDDLCRRLVIGATMAEARGLHAMGKRLRTLADTLVVEHGARSTILTQTVARMPQGTSQEQKRSDRVLH